MTGSGNHTYLLIDEDASRRRSSTPASVSSRISTRCDGTLDAHHAGFARCWSRTAHPDHASGAPAIAARIADARFFKYPWPEEDGATRSTGVRLRDGDRFRLAARRCWRLHTPGHSPDHIAFWHEAEPHGVHRRSRRAGRQRDDRRRASGGDLPQYLASLEAAPGARRRASAAGARTRWSPIRQALLRGYIAHRPHARAQVIAALAAGRDTVPAIAESIYDGLAPALLPAARENVRAHLEKLRREGRATERDGRWTIAPS